MRGRFENKVVLITGSGSGIGLASAKRIAEEGGTVVSGILSDEQAEAVSSFSSVILDVREETSWDAAVDFARKNFGGLDVLINSAGISPTGTAEETSQELWDEVMAINLRGSFLGCKKAIPLMRERGAGAIVNIASINGKSTVQTLALVRLQEVYRNISMGLQSA